ncbi:unnamed protein product [Schistosoma margrebowiei]|uniref:Uncharacterized protein n=1 Tax=Schistosoma margrebowiei TaxID=48269 RepID=A0A183LI64_9TREM|nr:unnamed protein product [Schistosoma margrebowiei]
MKSTSEGKHGIKWTARKQSENSDFADDLVLLRHTHQRMQVKKNNVTAASASVSPNMRKGKKQVPQIQHREHQPDHT